jgi:hypothetical protein
MYTTAALFALSGLLAAAPVSESPTWLTDYSKARKEGESKHKPLAVFLGSGPLGWNAISESGTLDRESKRLLAKRYVCVYVDMGKRAGKDLAADFEMRESPGLIISDVSGTIQAFRHEGDLSAEKLGLYLERYADPQRTVSFTETNPSERTSYYPPPPVYVQPSFIPSGGGRSC